MMLNLRSVLAATTVAAFVATPPAGAQNNAGVSSHTGMVVCTSAPACDAGAAVLARGGNAVDAAVATAFALAVTHPSPATSAAAASWSSASANGAATTFDYREKAPAAVDADDVHARRQDRHLADQAGYLAPGVPGTVRGLALAHKRFGKLPWKDVVMPAVQLAEKGFDRVRRPRAQPQRAARGHDGPVSGVGRGVRQARRRHMGRRAIASC